MKDKERQSIGPKCEQRIGSKFKLKGCLRLVINEYLSMDFTINKRWRSGAVVRASDFGPRCPWFEPLAGASHIYLA